MSLRQAAAVCILLSGGVAGGALLAVAAQLVLGDFRKIGVLFPGVAIGIFAAWPLARRVLALPNS